MSIAVKLRYGAVADATTASGADANEDEVRLLRGLGSDVFIDDDQDNKLAKSEVSFEHPARGPHHCSECEYFEAPDACALVEGTIAPGDWCEKFAGK